MCEEGEGRVVEEEDRETKIRKKLSYIRNRSSTMLKAKKGEKKLTKRKNSFFFL